MTPTALKLIVILVVVVAAPFVLACALGRSLLYHPTRTQMSVFAELARRPGWQRAPIAAADGTALVGLVRPAAGEAPWLVFYGGNAMAIGEAQSWLDLVSADLGWGAAVWAYRGYDGSAGAPSEAALIADADAQVAHLAAAFAVAPSQLILAGWSLGSGVAAAEAAALSGRGTPPRALVMLAPYTSMATVFSDHAWVLPVGWAVPDPYRTDQRLTAVRCPILVIHGADDRVIGVEHGRTVAKIAGERGRYLELDAVGHDVLGEPQALAAIRGWVRATQ